MKNVEAVNSKKQFWAQVLKGVLIATSISLVGILLFALIIKFVGITDNFIMPINQVIKVLSIFFGCFVALKKQCGKGIFKGMAIGFFYTLLAYVLFSSLSGNFAFNWSLLNDLLFGVVLGGISGIIVANIRK